MGDGDGTERHTRIIWNLRSGNFFVPDTVVISGSQAVLFIIVTLSPARWNFGTNRNNDLISAWTRDGLGAMVCPESLPT